MTEVFFRFSETVASGEQPLLATVRFTPSAEREENNTLVFPKPFSEYIGRTGKYVPLTPTTPEWYWKIEVIIPSRDKETGYYAIPDGEPINYTDLEKIAVETMPDPRKPLPAWVALLNAGLKSMKPGPQGDKGDPGERGPKGPQGNTGESIKGNTGNQGPKGNKGDRGDKGDQGDRGEKGDKGDSIKGDKGDKGDVGIGWGGTALTTENLNTITTNGIYNINAAPANWKELNYPSNISGNVMVMNRTTGRATQLFVPNTVAGDWDRGIWIRNQTGVNNEFARGWKFIGSQRVDNTAGRAIYTWDDTNNREQLIYGDTGWRGITDLVTSDFTVVSGVMRRVGNYVTINVEQLKSMSPPNANPVFLNPPSGFKPEVMLNNSMGNQRYGVLTEQTGMNPKVISPENGGAGLRLLSYTAGLVLHGSVSYYTRDPWPTTLPGTALGIPSNPQ